MSNLVFFEMPGVNRSAVAALRHLARVRGLVSRQARKCCGFSLLALFAFDVRCLSIPYSLLKPRSDVARRLRSSDRVAGERESSIPSSASDFSLNLIKEFNNLVLRTSLIKYINRFRVLLYALSAGLRTDVRGTCLESCVQMYAEPAQIVRTRTAYTCTS